MIDKCPNCGDSSSLRQILYGMPEAQIDLSKFKLGGCCISGSDPTITCVNCDWEGEFVNNIELMQMEN